MQSDRPRSGNMWPQQQLPSLITVGGVNPEQANKKKLLFFLTDLIFLYFFECILGGWLGCWLGRWFCRRKPTGAYWLQIDAYFALIASVSGFSTNFLYLTFTLNGFIDITYKFVFCFIVIYTFLGATCDPNLRRALGAITYSRLRFSITKNFKCDTIFLCCMKDSVMVGFFILP